MNPILDGWEKEKPAKKKRVEKLEPEPAKEAPPVDPNWVKAQNWKQSNVMTRAQWEAHLKKIAE